MIIRLWTGTTKKGRENDYVEHLKNDTFKRLPDIEGFLKASILRRELNDEIEFLIITEWESLEAIRKFAGEDYRIAVVPNIAQEMMIRYDLHAKHYEVNVEIK